MGARLNCWEFNNCGMEPGGIFADKYGPCPIPRMMKYDGVNSGRGAGRICWSIMNGSLQNNHLVCRNSRHSCFHCSFYNRVQNEIEISASKKEELTPIG
jgi:eukaryotic-like serine/threonine-protein kinase